MPSIRYPVFVAIALALLPLAAPAAPDAKPAKPTKEQIAKWIKDLGDGDFETREEASKKLWEAGEAAEAPLRAALKSDDVEVKRRARELLDKFKWGIYPDTPKPVIALITDYQTADAAGKATAVRKFFAAGTVGIRALVRVARSEKREEFLGILFTEVGTEAPKAMPRLLAEKDYETAEALLDLSLADMRQANAGIANYVAYWLLRGKLPARIAHHEALLKIADGKKETDKQYEILALLHRAAGNLEAARETADKGGRRALAENMLYEAGDWKALAARKDLTFGNSASEKLAYRAAFHRLAGDAKGMDEALEGLRKLAKAPGMTDRFAIAKALLLNDRPAEGVELLDGPDLPRRFEILVAQLKIAEALALVDRAKKDKDRFAEMEVLQARTLYSMGETDKATAIFDRLAKEIKPGQEQEWWKSLIDAEYRAGLRDRAFEHLAQALPVGPRNGDPTSSLFPKVFGERAVAAESLWAFLRQKTPAEKPVDTLKTLRGLLGGKLPAKTLTDLAEAGQARAKAIRSEAPAGNAELHRLKDEEADRLLVGLAEAALAAGQESLALTCLENGKTGVALMRLGDLLAAKKEWDKAADRYRQAWEANRTQPLPLFLRGWALTQSGKAKEGKSWIELSHWLPLGEEALRRGFVRALAERGHEADAKRENELLLRTGQPGSFYVGEALRRRAFYDPDRKGPLKVALRHEQGMLRCLSSFVNFVQGGAYAGVPAMIHSQRARGFLAAGKVAEAEKEAALCRACQPGYVDLPISLVPGLDKLGRKKEATALFDQTLAVYEKLCRDYPRCAWAHNSAAWLSACCRRDLDKALEHAKKAVDLSPKSSGYLDTLAEVYFQRGDRDKAVAAQKKAIALDPKKPYYRKQLKRIEAGDPTAERPPENE